MTPRWYKLVLCNISAQISQQANTRRRSLLSNVDHPITRMMQVTDNKYFHTTTTITSKALMPRMFIRIRRDVRNVEILYILRVSSVHQRNISASLATSIDTLQAYVIKRNKFLSSLGNQRPICCKQELYILMTNPYVATQRIFYLVISLVASTSGYCTPKLILRRFPHHLT